MQMYTKGLDQTMPTIHPQDSYTQHQPGKKTRLELLVFLHGQNTIFVLQPMQHKLLLITKKRGVTL